MKKRKKLNILIVIGTRPEAIKMAPVIINLKKNKKFKVKLCITAQHRKMLDDVLNFFRLKPDFDLNIMKKNQSLFILTSNILLEFEKVLNIFKPHIALVHGDTTTTMAISLACFYKKVSLAHVEAGLRTGNIYSPWPEEANRKITDILSVIHFAPVKSSKLNLLKENIGTTYIKQVGNTVIDALQVAIKKINKNKVLRKNLDTKYDFLKKDKFILVTAHRRENFGKGIKEICKSLIKLSLLKKIKIVYPVHLNPNIKEIVYRMLKNKKNIYLIDPVDYPSMIYLMSKSYMIITDSGGIQEEAPSLNKPLVIVRDFTERPEILYLGGGVLAKRNNEDIYNKVKKILENKNMYKKMSSIKNPYGDGKASKRIIKQLSNFRINL